MQFFKKVKGVLQMAHNGIVYDSDPHFKINVDTRQISNESTKKTSLIQFDHKSERFSFEMDRFVEGHDMTECNRVEVHFTNIGTKADEVSEDVYDVVDVHTDTDDENKIVFSWLLSSNATKYEGKLKFLIRFACTSDDGTVEYAWHTAKFNNITISKGLNNGKSVVDTYSDILAQWEGRIIGTIPYSDIGSLHGQNKAGFYKVVGRTSLGNYKSVECMLVSFDDTDASTTQHYFFNDGRIQFRTLDIASGWSEWTDVGVESINIINGEATDSVVQGQILSNWNPSDVNDKVVEYIENNALNENGKRIQLDDEGRVAAGAFGDNSASFGTKSQALGGKSFAEGSKTIAFGNNTHAEGNGTFAVGQHSHSEGSGTTAIGNASHAEGIKSISYSFGSHAEGIESISYSLGSHAEGIQTQSKGEGAHAEGDSTIAEGKNAHAEGKNTEATGDYSHAEGISTKASARTAHTEGFETIAQHDESHAEGVKTITGGNNQHVQGKWNKIMDENYAHVVGNGTDEINRSNAHTLDWDGNAWFAGTVEATGLILKSPNGTRFMLTVDDTGELATKAI